MTGEMRSEVPNTRRTLIQHILSAAFKRYQDLEKIMVDPIDVLVYLVEDPSVQQTLLNAQVNLEQLDGEIKKMDEQTMLINESAKDFVKKFGPQLNISRSPVLDLSIEEAALVADSEGSFDITPQHLLAGILRHNANTGATVFRNIGLAQTQYYILARFPLN